MDEDYKYNLTENKNNSYHEDNIKNYNNNINNLFSLYNNFFIKKNRYNTTSKNKKPNYQIEKEIMPKYSNIHTQIKNDKDLLKDIYQGDPILKESIRESHAINIFKEGFKKLFFGPNGLVTRKNIALKKFYKSFRAKKVNFNEKLYIGSMDLFESLGNSTNYNKRLKSNQRRIISINGNFDMTNPRQMKIRKTYRNLHKKIAGISKDKIKEKKLNDNINSENNKIKNKRFSQIYNKSSNLFLDYKNNLFPDSALKLSLNKRRKTTRQNTDMNFLFQKKSINISAVNKSNNNSQNNKLSSISNIKPIPNSKLFINSVQNSLSKNQTNKSIKNLKKEISKKENNNENKNKNKNKNKNEIETYISKSINFEKYFKQKKEFKKYVDSFKKSMDKKIVSSNNSNNKIRDKINRFIIKKEKYVLKTNKYFIKKIEEPYDEFKEDSKKEEDFQNFAKNVDFSNKALSSQDKRKDKINTINMAYTFRVGFEANVPVKEFLKKFKRKKEKEKENKILKSVRLHFNTNSKIIHNLTISLDDIKKKYNY